MKRSQFKARKPSKYKNRRTWSVLCGRWFDSAAECRYGEHLYAREANGEICDLQYQVPVRLEVNGVKVAGLRVDFSYVEDGELIWCEFKGLETPTWRHKKKLWSACGPGTLIVVYDRKSSKLDPWFYEVIHPAGEEDAP